MEGGNEGGREHEQRPGNTGCVRSGLNEQRVGWVNSSSETQKGTRASRILLIETRSFISSNSEC